MTKLSDSDTPHSSTRSIPREGPRSLLTVTLFLITEFIKWLMIMVAIYLGAWQYCEIMHNGEKSANLTTSTNGYAKCSFGDGNTVAEFWGIFTGIVVGISLLVYVPWRIVAIRLRFKYFMFRDERWRPAILFYILLAAVPAFALILAATQLTKLPAEDKLDPVAITSLQMVVMGLVVTEWMVKIQQEHFTYDLMTDMALDFFFAYEVIAFVMLSATVEVASTAWIYPSFVFSVVAMCKYLPTDPVDMPEWGVSWGHVIHVLISLFCNDIPFVVIRMSTVIIFHKFLISDMIFLFKNWFLIFFGCIKIALICYNRNRPMDDSVPKKRRFRGAEVWCDPKDGVCRVRVAAMATDKQGSSSTIERIVTS